MQAIAIIGAVAAVAGAGVSAYASYEQGQQQEQVAEANARRAEYEAEQEKKAAEVRAARYKREAERRMSAMRAGYAASGVATTEGTPLLVLMESAEEAALDELRIKRGGEHTAWGLLQEANIQRIAGKGAVARGTWGAGATLLTGASRAASQYSRWSN